tara:strand:+ start:41 stop:172 length:132 start_codon:yes stop_codon:yes gene_type:complete
MDDENFINSRPLKVAVVDDDIVMIRLLEFHFKKEGIAGDYFKF